MALLDEVKLSLGGMKHSKLDGDILDTIEAADAELKISGADAGPHSADGGALYRQAVKLYCRAHYNYQGEGERWRAAFEGLRDHIALSGLYREDANENKPDALL